MNRTKVSNNQTSTSEEKSLLQRIPRLVYIVILSLIVIVLLCCVVWFEVKKHYQVESIKQDDSLLNVSSSTQIQNMESSTTSIQTILTDYELSTFTIPDSGIGADTFYVDTSINQIGSISLEPTPFSREIHSLIKRQGKNAIKYPKKFSVYPEPWGQVTFGIISTEDHSYLVEFSVGGEKKDEQSINISTVNTLRMKTVTDIGGEVIKNSFGEHVVVKVSGVDVAGNEIRQYFKIIGKKWVGNLFSEIIKKDDGTFYDRVSESVEGKDVVVTFDILYGSDLYRSFLSTESFDGTSSAMSVYSKAKCGLEDGYGDVSFDISDYRAIMDINFGLSPTIVVTEKSEGNNLNNEDISVEKITMPQFVEQVKKPTAFNSSSTVEILTLGGYEVKHIGPIVPDQGCYPSGTGNTFDVYQVVKNGAVITFSFFNLYGDQSHIFEVQNLVAKAIDSFTVTKK